MEYNKPTIGNTYVTTPYPITSNGVVSYLNLIALGNIKNFGIQNTKVDDVTSNWYNGITEWETFFKVIDAHLKTLNAAVLDLESQVKEIKEISWQSASGTSKADSGNPNIQNYLISITYKNGSISNGNPQSIEVYSNASATSSNLVTNSTWYNTEGRYYIVGVYGTYKTKNQLIWDITAANKQQFTITVNGNTISCSGISALTWSTTSSGVELANVGPSASTIINATTQTKQSAAVFYISGTKTITEGESTTLTITYVKQSNRNISVTVTGKTTDSKYSPQEKQISVNVSYDSECPSSIKLNNGQTVTLNNGSGTITVSPSTTTVYSVSGYTTLTSAVVTVNAKPQPTTTYYWYSGITKPTAENIASIATGSSKSIESWQGKEFAVTNNANTPQYAYFCTPADYNVTWWDKAHTAQAQPSDNYKGTFTYNNVTYVYWWRAKTLQSNATLPFYAWTN